VKQAARRGLAVGLCIFIAAAAGLLVFSSVKQDPSAPVTPGFTNGNPIDVIFVTSVPLFPGTAETSVSAAESATDGKTLQPDAGALPGPDKTPNVWVFKTDVGYRYGNDLVIQTTPYTIKTDPADYLQNHIDAFGGRLTTISGYPALVRPAHSFESSERQLNENTLVVVPEAAVDTTVIEMIIGDTEVTIFGLELTESEALKVAESLR
jgi:hypothetical protein